MTHVALMTVFAWLALPSYPETTHHEPSPDQPARAIAAAYQSKVDRIVSATMAGNDAYRKMEALCDGIGHRFSGSPELEKAIDWALRTLKADGQENVHREDVLVPHWVRGRESATMVEPRVAGLPMLGLGGSVGTPPDGITAPVVVVSDEAGLDALGDGARGKIVLFNNPMPDYNPEKGSGYGKTVRFRSKGARLASEKGAVACLVRSVTANSLRTPHTGAMRYGDAKVKIPAAAITTEDASMLARLVARGVRVVVTLKMEAETFPDATSGNVIAELRGRSHPDEIVVISGHFDSWDVGHGAHDDAGGCVAAMEAISVLRKLGMIPRRTIRVVLWTNEENGLRGGKQYAEEHADEMHNHVAALESDGGSFRPIGISVETEDDERTNGAAAQLRDIMSVFESMGATSVKTGWSGADISPMKSHGVVLLGHRVEGSKYFDYHHTSADTLDKIDPIELSQNVAVMASVAYILADMPGRLGEPKPR